MSNKGPTNSAALALISCITFGFEFLLFRLMAGQSGFDLVPLILSLAIFGGSIGASLRYFRAQPVSTETTGILFLVQIVFFALTMMAFSRFAPGSLAARTPFLLIFSAALFCISGFLITDILGRTTERRGRLYFFDLAGGVAGILIFFAAATYVSLPVTGGIFLLIGISGMLFFFSGLSSSGKKTTLVTLIALVVTYAFLVKQGNSGFSCGDSVDEDRWFSFTPGEVRTNSFSKIDVTPIEPRELVRSPTRMEIPRAAFSGITRPKLALIDCKGVSMGFVKSGHGQVRYFDYEVQSVPFFLRKVKSVATIGGGLGLEVSRALNYGAEKVLAAEINPLFEKLSRDLYGESDVLSSPKVTTIYDDGRRALAKSGESFDLITVVFTKRFGALGASGFSLVSNTISTEEAFELYYQKLSPEGMILNTDFSPVIDHIAETWANVLKKQGLKSHDYLLAFGDRGRMKGVLISKTPFTAKEKSTLDETLRRFGNRTVAAEELHRVGYSITDDHPPLTIGYYFANITSILFSHKGIDWSSPLIRKFTGEIFLFFSLLVAVGIFFLWLILSRIDTLAQSTYFSLIGFGFIFALLTALQKFSFTLSEISLAVPWILVNAYFASALGSLWVDRWKGSARMLPFAETVTCLLLVAGYFLFDPIHSFAYAQSGFWRFLPVTLFLWPLFFFSGTLFPARIIGLEPKQLAGAFAVNGVSALIGTILAAVAHSMFGFKSGFLFAALFYLGAGISACCAFRRS